MSFNGAVQPLVKPSRVPLPKASHEQLQRSHAREKLLGFVTAAALVCGATFHLHGNFKQHDAKTHFSLKDVTNLLPGVLGCPLGKYPSKRVAANDRSYYWICDWIPTLQPTAAPTNEPTAEPTNDPTHKPTTQPTGKPTDQPTNQPTGQPTTQPTGKPTRQPTDQPIGQSNTCKEYPYQGKWSETNYMTDTTGMTGQIYRFWDAESSDTGYTSSPSSFKLNHSPCPSSSLETAEYKDFCGLTKQDDIKGEIDANKEDFDPQVCCACQQLS